MKDQYKTKAQLIAELNETRQQLTDIVDQQSGFVYRLQLDKNGRWQFRYISPAVQLLLGIPAETIEEDANRLFQAILPDDATLVQAAILASQQNLSPFKAELRLVDAAGQVHTVLAHAIPLRQADDSTLWLGTARKLTGENLHQSEHRFRKLFHALPLPIYAWQRVENDFILLDYNETADRYTDQAIRDVVGQKAKEFHQNQPLILADLERCYQEKRTVERKMAYEFRSGRVQLLNIKYSYVSDDLVIVMTEDLTEREQAMEQYRTFFIENVSPVFWLELEEPLLVNSPVETQVETIYNQAIYKDLSDTMAQTYGFARREDVMGKPTGSVWHPDSNNPQSAEYQTLRAFVENGYEVHQYESKERTPAGETKWLLVNARGIVENGRLLRIWGSQTDITERKKTELALQESKDRYRTLFELANDFVFLHKFDSEKSPGNFVEVNQLACERLGYTQEEMRRLRPRDIFEAADWVEMLPEANAFLPNNDLKSVKNLITKTGSTIPIELHARLFDYRGETYFISIGRDISVRLQAEQALLQSEARFRLIFDNAPIGIAVGQSNGQIYHTNNSFCQMLGYRKKEMNSLTVADITVPSSMEDEIKIIQAVQEGALDGYAIEKQFVRRDGSTFWASLHTNVIRNIDGEIEIAIGMVQDISERRRTEASLRQMKKAIEHSPVGVMITNVASTIEYVNPKLCEITGYEPEEIIGRTPEMFRTGAHSPDFYDEMIKTLESGQVWTGEFHNRKKNGERYWELASMVGIKDKNGRITHYVAMKEDITLRKQREEEHVRQERLAAVGQLAAGIAHDFNNVMAVITLYSDLLQRSPNQTSKDLKKLQIISSQANHAADLTRQILDFSRRSIREPRHLDLKPLLNEILKFVSRTLPEKIQVHFSYQQSQESSYNIHGDPTQIQQIITNLTVNARDAMPQGGKINFILSRLALHPGNKPPSKGMKPGLWIVLTINDTGEGIEPEILPHIFEPFFTNKEVGKGSGLGLAQVYGIVKQHEGFITVKSSVGEGTTFSIYFPASAGISQPNQKQQETIKFQGHGEMILLVEDNPTLLEATSLSLEMLNYRVIKAEDGRAALSIYKEYKEQIALVLADVMMPFVDGFELVTALQKLPNPPKIIMMSGFPRDQEAPSHLLAAISGWLSKPLDIQNLAKILANTLSEG